MKSKSSVSKRKRKDTLPKGEKSKDNKSVSRKHGNHFPVPDVISETDIIMAGYRFTTVKELSHFYLSKLRSFRSADPSFLELHYIQNERGWVRENLKGFSVTNKNEPIIKRKLFRYLGGFVNIRLTAAKDEFERSPSQFEISLQKYTDQYYNERLNGFTPLLNIIDDINLKKNYIESEIKRVENVILEWAQKMSDVTSDLHKKARFLAGQKYLNFLKEKESEYADSVGIYVRKKQGKKGNPDLPQPPYHPYSLEGRLTITGAKVLKVLLEKHKLKEADAREWVIVLQAMLNRSLADGEIFGRGKVLGTMRAINNKFNIALTDTPFYSALLQLKKCNPKYLEEIEEYKTEMEGIELAL